MVSDMTTLAARPAKKARLLDDSDSDNESEQGGVTLKINDEYAKRYEYNQKLKERHRLEEKYGKGANLDAAEDEEEDSEADVEEDDAGELVTEDLDAQIAATLQAIRNKDPRVYDPNIYFYDSINDPEAPEAEAGAKEKPMTLKDYHTKNLLEGKFEEEEEDTEPVKTHQQELEDVRQDALKAINAAVEDDEDDDFLVVKPKSKQEKRVKITEADVENADKDPETFLSNFMASRAWVPTEESHWKPLESEDEEEIARAEEYEAAYNMYFEDPTGANEKLVTYARDAVAKTTVRREEKSARQKAREAARAKREAEKKQREEEIARLRKLRIEEMEHKVEQIRKYGGFTGREFNVEDWADILEADWSDEKFDEEMAKRFGDAYYGEGDDDLAEDKKKPKKPKFDDDIDITDIIPDFEDDLKKPAVALTDGEEESDVDADAMAMDVDEDDEEGSRAHKSSKKRKQERAEAKSAARRDRRLIEKLVDSNLEYDAKLASSSRGTGFRYRETTPETFGLTARDILLASDAQLNEFAGLKKLASFRDPVKKKRDKKSLSKKARLRQWRVDTFGDPDGPKGGFEPVLGEEAVAAEAHGNPDLKAEVENDGDIREGKRKKKRSRKRKAADAN